MFKWVICAIFFNNMVNVIFCMESDIQHSSKPSVATNKMDQYQSLKTLDDPSYQRKLKIDTYELEKIKLSNENRYDLAKLNEEKIKIWIALKYDLLFWMHDYLKKENEKTVVNNVVDGVHYPLHLAITHKSPNVLQLLLQTKPNLNVTDGVFQETPFQCALRYEQATMAKRIATAELTQQITNSKVDIEKLNHLIKLAKESSNLKLGAKVASHIQGLIEGHMIAKG